MLAVVANGYNDFLCKVSKELLPMQKSRNMSNRTRD